jgi:hypothetical protein
MTLTQVPTEPLRLRNIWPRGIRGYRFAISNNGVTRLVLAQPARIQDAHGLQCGMALNEQPPLASELGSAELDPERNAVALEEVRFHAGPRT